MKEHIDDAPMRLVEKLNKEDRKIADARAWRVAFQAWKSSLTRAEKTPQAYESIADLRDCVRRNEMLPLNPAHSDAALGRDVGASGGAGFASRDAEMRVGEAEMRHRHGKMWPCDSHRRHPKAPDGLTWLRVSA
eukprot:jgi/Tetstr1/422022/TSEL_012886.t1